MGNHQAEKAAETRGDAGFLAAIAGDGVLLLATAGGLVLAGGFAMLLAASGEFLPHDIAYLGMSAADLCSVAGCRVVDFMVHDRAAFGGALFAVGVLYAYLVLFPLRQGQAWAWWLLAVSGAAGFLSFLAYLGYGYLDTWHGLGTALLLPVFVVGLLRARRLVDHLASPLVLLSPRELRGLSARRRAGRACLLLGAAGTALGGLAILRVGITDVFVPEDLAFMGLSAAQLQAVSPRLVPLMAHDRAGFGGAVFTLGLTALFCLWRASPSRALWEALLVSGGVGLVAAIGVHGVRRLHRPVAPRAWPCRRGIADRGARADVPTGHATSLTTPTSQSCARSADTLRNVRSSPATGRPCHAYRKPTARQRHQRQGRYARTSMDRAAMSI